MDTTALNYPAPPFGAGRFGKFGWWMAAHQHHHDEHDGPPFPGGRRGRGGPRFGGPPWMGGPFGPDNRAKVRRGDTRDAVLLLLLEGPKHGYQLMAELSERSNGNWTPSPGSIYPVMRALEDSGLVTMDESDGRRIFTLTDDGRSIAERRQAAGPAPWEQFSAAPRNDIREAAMRLFPVLKQVAADGNPDTIQATVERLDGLRRDLYRLLADQPVPAEGEASPAADGQEDPA